MKTKITITLMLVIISLQAQTANDIYLIGATSAIGSGGAHLHLQIRLNNGAGEVLNPHDYIYSTYSKDANNKHTNGIPNNPCNK